MKRVLFVCLGNICRSPAAEGVFAQRVARAGVAHLFEVDSAGTSAHHRGERADSRMRAAAARRGLELHSRSRAVVAADFDHFDLIVAMDRANLAELKGYGGSAKLVLFGEYLDGDEPCDVPDPYYGGEQGFERVLDLLEAGCGPLLESLL